MPETSGEVETPSAAHSACNGVSVEASEHRRKHRQRNGGPRETSGLLTVGDGKSHANGVVTANGGIQSHAKSQANGVSAVVPRPIPPAAGSANYVVIREVYENGLASQFFELQLDYALDAGVDVIVIEPSRLGRETAQWLAIGACLRRAALTAWTAAVVSGAVRRDRTCLACVIAAGAMAAVYAVSWRPDPCSLYRVERDSRQLQRLPLCDIVCTAPVVLVRRRSSRLRRGVYGSVAAATLAVCAWRVYRWNFA